MSVSRHNSLLLSFVFCISAQSLTLTSAFAETSPPESVNTPTDMPAAPTTAPAQQSAQPPDTAASVLAPQPETPAEQSLAPSAPTSAPQPSAPELGVKSESSADSQKKSVNQEDRQAKAERKKKFKRDDVGEGYYYSSIKKKQDKDVEAIEKEYERHADQGGGYYGIVPEYKAPPPPPPVYVPPPPPPPVVVPIHHEPGERKFDDEPGKAGSITFNRHATQAKELLSSGHYDLAKKHFKEALHLRPNEKELLPEYWETCEKTSDWSESVRCLEHLFELDPSKEKEYCWAYGEALLEMRRFDKAVPTLKKALGFGVNVDQCHELLLKIAMMQNNTPEMLREYAVITKMHPGDFKKQLEYANLLEIQGRHSEALVHYKAAAMIQPEGGLLARIGYMLMSYNKDWNGAISFYNRARQADPANVANYDQNIAYCQNQLNLAAKAKASKK